MICALRRWFLSPDRRMRALVARMHRDQGGNIIVLYIAAALLLVGMLWAIIGTGARVVQKETIQSSADAAAFSAAVIKAKGLNIIAFCNLVMALLLAIIMLLRLVNDLLIIVVTICYAACIDIWGGEVLCALAPGMQEIQSNYSDLKDELEKNLLEAMKGLKKVEDAVNNSFQALALAEGMQVGMNGAYKKNMGHGTLITVTWPLPIGDDFTLLSEDDTWDKMCQEAAQTFDRVAKLAFEKIGLGPVGSIVGGAIGGLMNGLRGVFCPDDSGALTGGDPQMIDVGTNSADCNRCANPQSGETVTGAKWQCDRVLRDGDGKITGYAPAGECETGTVSGSWCGGGSSALVYCSDKSHFYGEHRLSQPMKCDIQKKQKQNAGNDLSADDKPKPLKLKWAPYSPEFLQHSQVRAFTLLTDTAMGERRQSVAVGSKNKGSAPFFNQMITMAQAEIFAFNGPSHADLWHMDWRARLVRFRLTDNNSSGTQPGANEILKALGDFLNSAGAALADQFLVH